MNKLLAWLLLVITFVVKIQAKSDIAPADSKRNKVFIY